MKPEQKISRLIIEVPTEQLEKFKYLCLIKDITKKRIITDYINSFLNKFWSKEIKTLYNKRNKS